MKEKFATCINCIDGRVQKPIIEFITNQFKVDYVDMITEPGPDKLLCENKPIEIVESIKRRVLISIEKHKSNILVIVGHYDCAGNPVDEKKHQEQTKKTVNNLRQWNLNVEIYGLWIDRSWKVFLNE